MLVMGDMWPGTKFIALAAASLSGAPSSARPLRNLAISIY